MLKFKKTIELEKLNNGNLKISSDSKSVVQRMPNEQGVETAFGHRLPQLLIFKIQQRKQPFDLYPISLQRISQLGVVQCL